MRHIILTAAMLAAGSPALASSIEVVATTPVSESTSVASLSCDHCPPVKEAVRKASYVAPELEPGTQTTEIREVHGERKLVRTEAWLGGSPVVFMSKLPVDTALAAKPASEPNAADAVDTAAKTSALPAVSAKPPVAAAMADAGQPAATEIDTSKFELRTE
ncbi:hypothetical protein MRS76_05930 [Rhizobiaceae bacterium n13]|uniref:Uncharacterized protein n=1 Tax=Ferirhizobium litorale TaxID=2927786 RepID=A0AAE3QE97_9HYPH|nr:plant virulence effector HPE1-like domain-containing protein [Fererhizobium litorale]MDI7861488.1 hypothetical protein [Fererhizobium litorale]MDI7921634.1 hypothetical protein [Fererhizobium litorale]